MKNKRLSIFLIILAFLVVVIVLSSTIFSLSNVSVNWLSTTNVLTNLDEQIIESASFKKGESVFFLNKKSYSTNLEKAYPYLKVVNIETVFPNSLKINAVERNEAFVIKLDNNKYISCDEELKALQELDVFYNSASNGIVINNSGLSNQTITAGDFFTTENKFLTTLFNCFREWDVSYNFLKSNISSITLDYENIDGKLLVEMRSGVQIEVVNSTVNLSDKLNLAFSFYDTDEIDGIKVDYTKEGIIEIREDSTGNLNGYYYSK